MLQPHAATPCCNPMRSPAQANFEAAMRGIPDGSPVVFAFGEIDCREGLLVAIERARYKTLEEARLGL